jgi:hypothetical protein
VGDATMNMGEKVFLHYTSYISFGYIYPEVFFHSVDFFFCSGQAFSFDVIPSVIFALLAIPFGLCILKITAQNNIKKFFPYIVS